MLHSDYPNTLYLLAVVDRLVSWSHCWLLTGSLVRRSHGRRVLGRGVGEVRRGQDLDLRLRGGRGGDIVGVN